MSRSRKNLCVHSWAQHFVLLSLLLSFSSLPARAIGPEVDAVPADVSKNWSAAVEKQIADAEYEVTWQPATALPDLESSWQAPNRVHDFRTYFTADGIRVVPRAVATSWEWSLRLARWGRPGSAAQTLARASLQADKNRFEYDRGTLLESYINDQRGLEQTFTIARPPMREDGVVEAGTLVRLDLELGGTLSPVISADGQAIDFVTQHGARIVRYTGLRVTDARGQVLRSWMDGFSEAELRGIRIVYDDTDAIYPVLVDPLATSPAWTAEIDQASSFFGVQVATAGDVNGDGYADVIVGAHTYDNGQTDEGRAFVYLGSAAGLAMSAAWTAESDQANAQFGWAAATAGDVNGDGYSDVIVGAYVYDNGQTDEGRAYVYLGSAAGLATSAAWTAESNQASARLGLSVATAGDVNGDGYSDVIVGADLYDNGQTDEGRAFVYLGSAAGLAASAAWTAESDQASAQFGWSSATAGDVNGDGYADVVVGAYLYDNGQSNEGRAYVYLGSAAGLAASAAWTAESDQINAQFGWWVSTAGDVNGDGYADVVVGARTYDNGQTDEGRAFAYLGSATGLASSAAWTAESDQAAAYFGDRVATAGDVNGDGYADVIVGARAYDNGQTDEGRAFVYFGSAAGLATSAGWTAESDQASAVFGFSAATAGDVNGDGYADVIVGAYLYDNGQDNEGRAFVYFGSATGLATSAAWNAESDQASAAFGISVATAGDVNGDGYADVIVGANLYDNGQSNEGRAYVYLGSATGLATSAAWNAESDQANAAFGLSVATAGDVNGDGYADVIVGARFYDNGQPDEGGSFVYHGSAAGLASSAAWTAESNQASARFGTSVAGAGDVNGDGYADVIVGADFYDNGKVDEGGAFVYHGSAAGLVAGAVWAAQSSQASAAFGSSVATAGDVNGDGYSDVVVAARRYDNGESDEGRAYVYLGSAAGLAASEVFTAESDQLGANFGSSVATAGDVNGDGYADVIVGASNYANGESGEGRAFVYLGSAAGLTASAAWTGESDQTIAAFGTSAASAGDVNGDGYADVIVGASGYDNGQTDEGRAFVYLGSAAGLATSAAWTAESDQASAIFGISVGTAGDVNGDGYADVIVGARMYDNGETDEGRSFVYYGNGGRALSLSPRQRQPNDAAPISHLGRSDSVNSFRLSLNGRTPFGRGRAKLEWEVKPLGTLFNGVGTAIGTPSDTGVSGVTLSELVTGLFDDTSYHWRARLRYDAVTTPFAQNSRWLTMPWKGWQEAMLSTLSDACLSEGNPVVCDDGNVCTVDTCDSATGCVFTGIAGSCNDGNACTTNDTCAAGACVGGAPLACDDGNLCTDNSCNPATGCVYVNNTVTCDDGDACTQTDACQAGVCVGSTPVVCTASDQCHVAGTCNPGTGLCTNPNAVNGTGCNDANACTQLDSCQSGVCVGSNPVVCVASDQCHVAGTCDPQSGSCSNPDATDGTGCNDGDACTQLDSCESGFCLGRNPVVCTASDQCHVAGTCDPETGTCTNPNAPNGTGCNDGNACTQTDTCQGGSCLGDNPVVCTASDRCHLVGTCNPGTGICTNPNAANGTSCNDGNACTQLDTCLEGLCSGGNPVICSASDPCHVAGACNPGTGICTNPNAANGTACNDGSACTQTDTCQSGSCSGGNPVICSASDQCHVAGTCNPANGNCSDPRAVNGTGCSDGNACTLADTCQSGSCSSGSPVVCSASDQCHVAGTCDTGTGICTNPNAANGTGCNDGSACTQTDTCQSGSCSGGNPVICSASDQCHVAGTCDTGTGICTNPNAANGTGCNDANACTTSDVCTSGSCSGTPGVVPGEVGSVSMSKSGPSIAFGWSATAGASAYDMLRGRVRNWPVGSSPATETCLSGNVIGTTSSDGSLPATGTGYWYLFRAENACGNGSYGSQAVQGAPTVTRVSGTCP